MGVNSWDRGVILQNEGANGGGTPMPLFLAGRGEMLACIPVAVEDDRIADGRFDESCSSCHVSSFQSSDLALKLGFRSVTRRFRPFPYHDPFVFPFLLVR